MTRYVCLFAAALLFHPAALQSQELRKEPTKRVTTCGELYRYDLTNALNPQTPFDPACWVRLFEDHSSQRRTVLYSPHRPYQFSRILSADQASTLVLDFAEALNANGDVGLNQLVARARIARTDGTTAPIEVKSYNELEFTAEQRRAQRAFGFQTFGNVSATLLDLWFTTRDLILRLQDGEKCYSKLTDEKTETPAQAQTECLAALGDAPGQTKALDLYEPEAKAIVAFFTAPANRTVNSQLAMRLFEVSDTSLVKIAEQIARNFERLKDPAITDDKIKEGIRQQIMERIFAIANDFAWAEKEVKYLAAQAANAAADTGARAKLREYCPGTVDQPPALAPKRETGAYQAFATACFIESERAKYVRELERYLVTGTISLRQNGARPGDTIWIEVEARGEDETARGAVAQFEVRVTNYGWKWAITDSVLFINRLRVTASETGYPPRPADLAPPANQQEVNVQNALYGRGADQLRKVRFRPFPGFNLVANYYHRGGRPLDANDAGKEKLLNLPGRWLDADKYNLPARGAAHTLLRALSPGFGLNTTLMNFGDDDASAVQVGVGPIVTFFDNRVSFTTGLNLMARERRWYWGVGFSFLRLTDEVMGKFSKNR